MSVHRSILNFITAICYVIHDNSLLWTEDHNVYTSVQNIADRVTGNTNKLFNDKLIITDNRSDFMLICDIGLTELSISAIICLSRHEVN